MRVLISGDTVGGVFTYVCELTRALTRLDAEVHLFLAGRRLSAGQRAELRRTGAARVFAHDLKLEWMPDPWDDVDRAGECLLEVAEGVEPDVVHLNDYSHGSLPWRTPVLVVGHSCVLSWHAAVRRAPAGPEWDVYRARVTDGLRGADVVVAPTRAMLRELARYYGPLEHTAVVPNGRAAGARARTRKRQLVVACGRMWDEAKNLAALERAAARLDGPVLVAGEPAPGPAPRHVRLLGQVGRDELEALFADAAVFAAPAVYEPFGLAALEAALARCALVLGDIPSVREVWGDAALYVDPCDDEALAAAIEASLASPALGAAAYERAQTYTPERMAHAYLALYERLTLPAPLEVAAG